VALSATAGSPPQAAGLAELRKALELDPRSLAAHTLLALHWERQGEYARSREALQAALEIEPHNPALLAGLGNILALQGDLQAAYGAYLAATEAAPRDPAYRRLLAGFSLKYDYAPAVVGLPAARQAILLQPDDPANLVLMAQVLIRLEDLVNAERFLYQALAADANYAPAHLHLGLIYLLRGESSRARQELNRVKVLAPGSPAAEQADHWLQEPQRLHNP
jgi:Tfp pilus assembly protein PilF